MPLKELEPHLAWLQERDGVVAALRVQLKQRQRSLEAQESASPALVSAGSIAIQEEAVALPSRAASTGSNQESLPILVPPQPGMSREASDLEAIWTSSPDLTRLVSSLAINMKDIHEHDLAGFLCPC